MALAECKVLAVLLSLVAALFLLANALPFHHHGSSRLQGVDVVGLTTRRNVILLCNAILLVVLRDAGLLLGTPARRRRRTATAAITAATTGALYSPEPSHASSVVVWRPRNRTAAAVSRHENAVVDEIGGIKCQRQGTRALIAWDETARCGWTEPEQDNHDPEYGTIQRRAYLDDWHDLVDGELDQPAAVDGKSTVSPWDFGLALVVVAGDDSNRAEAEEGALGEEECGEEEEDLDEMNRRFDAFIADTKEKMRLEALDQLLHVAGE